MITLESRSHFIKKTPIELQEQVTSVNTALQFDLPIPHLKKKQSDQHALQKKDPHGYLVYRQTLRELRGQKRQPEHQWRFRTEEWLKSMFEVIRINFFSDIPVVNNINVLYGSFPWKNRLGLIRLSDDSKKSEIQINPILQDSTTPLAVPITALAHEFTHYAHGFGSPHPRKYEHPHNNNVIQNELTLRRLGTNFTTQDQWIDTYWFSTYNPRREAYFTDRRERREAQKKRTTYFK